MYTSHKEQRTNLLMFLLSIEKSPKLTTKIGVTTITRDRTNFNKYMYLCLKECNSFLKKNSQVILNLGSQKNPIPTKPRKEEILDFS